MSLLRLALEKQRWDLAAHTIVLAAARMLKQGGPDGGKKRAKKAAQIAREIKKKITSTHGHWTRSRGWTSTWPPA
jgi:hypothetical protein